MKMELECDFKKLPGDKIIVAELSRSLRWLSVMSAYMQRVCEFRVSE